MGIAQVSCRATRRRRPPIRAIVTTMGALTLLAIRGGWAPELLAAKPVRYTPVTMTFRCVETGKCTSGDRVQGDPYGAYVGNGATLFGVFLNSIHDLALRLDAPAGEYLFIDFGDPAGSPSCVASGTCRRVGSYAFTTVQTFSTMPDSLLDPIDAVGNERPNGLHGIAIDSTSNARFTINFPDPFGRAVSWSVRFDPAACPGSTFVAVRRSSANAWLVTTSQPALGRLVSTAGPGGAVDEGAFALPFQFAITQP